MDTFDEIEIEIINFLKENVDDKQFYRSKVIASALKISTYTTSVKIRNLCEKQCDGLKISKYSGSHSNGFVWRVTKS